MILPKKRRRWVQTAAKQKVQERGKNCNSSRHVYGVSGEREREERERENFAYDSSKIR